LRGPIWYNPVILYCDEIDMSNAAAAAILSVLRDINATPDKAVGMYLIGIPLVVEQQFTQDEVLYGLYKLVDDGVLELPGQNTLRLLKPLP
jgi:hypothetical protein